MRDIAAVMDETGSVSVSGAFAGFVEEHNAARLAITLNDDFAGENYTGLRLCFDTGPGGRKTVTNTAAGLPDEAPASREGGTLFCTLGRELTATGTLKAQVEALKTNGGEVEAAAKSQMFELFFRPSVTGGLPSEGCGCAPRAAAGCEGRAGFTRCSPAYYGALAVKRFDTLYLVDDALAGETPGDGQEEPAAVRVTGITLDTAALALQPGGTARLTATVLPADAANKAVVWSSSNTGVAAVEDGLVTALAAGAAVITATSADGGFTAVAALTVASLPGFWQGSKTVNGVTVTVSGNTVTLNGTKNNADYAQGAACFTQNVTNVFNADACPKWHTFAAGDTVTLKVTKTGGAAAGVNGANSALYMRDMNKGIVMAGATWSSPSGIWNYTFPANKDVGGLFGYLDTNAVFTNYAFTVELTVNSVRWL